MPTPRHLPLALLLLAPSGLLAAQGMPGPATALPVGMTVSLKQVSITITGLDAAARGQKLSAFKTAAAAFKSCDEVDAVAEQLGAQVVSNTALPAANVPEALRKRLETMPVGTATPLFGTPAEGVVRTLVLCGRSAG